jgi:hypothetical protein
MAATLLILDQITRMGITADFLLHTVLIGFLTDGSIRVGIGHISALLCITEEGSSGLKNDYRLQPTFQISIYMHAI